MEYDKESLEPIAGAFYAAPSYTNHDLNYFREEENLDLSLLLQPENEELEKLENFILQDNNLQSIKNNAEFITNKSPHTPTNRLLTSLFSKDRIKFILRYAIAYVKEASG
ncbi:MAG: hypothetical protein ACKO86_16955, partial [Dolichospermum sp.]